MSPFRKISPAYVTTPVSSPGCAASLTTCCAGTKSVPSVRTDTPPLCRGLMLWPSGASVKSVERPWGVAGAIPLVIKELGKVYFEVITPGDTKIVTNDTMIFSGQIYCYLEQDMPLQQLSQLETIYLSHRYRLTFRGSAYHALHWKEYERWPVGTGPDGNSGAQLPEAVPGVRVRIHNRIDNKPSQGVVPTITSPQFGSAPDRAG
jgi:hypothetical protein